MMEYLKEVFTKRQIKLLISGGITLILGLLIVLVSVKAANGLKDQQFAKRWCDDNSYAQVSAFFSELSGFKEDNIKEVEHKITNKLAQDSLSAESEDSRLWVYAYSANGEVTAISSNGSTKVKAIGVGGDYFLFHELKLLEGSFFNGDDIMKDLVVVDEETAWYLFGSNDIVGQFIMIGDVPHLIVGVIKREESKLNELAGNNQSTIYMSYDSLSKNGNVSYINTFEALMPNSLTGYAKTVLEENLPVDASRVEVIENSGRFHWTKLIRNVKNFGTRGMNAKGVIYPYWENMARGMEDYLTPVTVLACLLFVYPCGLLFFLLIRMWKKRTIHREDVKDFAERRLEEIRERKKLVKEGEKYE